MAHILVVEDDLKLLRTLKDALEGEGFDVDVAGNGLDAEELLTKSSYDLLVFDRGLPDFDGLELCKRFRSSGGQTPILFLTAQDTLLRKTEGFEAGADDYLTKPFQLLELTLRVKALLRRPTFIRKEIFASGGITLDTGKVQVLKDGEEIFLSRTEFALLECFMRNSGRVLTLEELIENVWPNSSGSSGDPLRACIKKLRAKIDGDASESLIKNMHGIGYRFGS